MKYRYEMHQHTRPCSHCGHADPVELVNKLKEQGFAGCVLTDHFYYGNSGIDRNLPWNDFCKAYEDTYLLAKKEGEKINFDVLFGLEEHIGNGKEVLLYGITTDFMYQHPELRDGGLEIIYKAAKDFGGLVIQAHPFRSRDYIDNPDEIVNGSRLDGYEIFNTANKPEDNQKAKDIYGNSGKIFTAGSDCHRCECDNRSGIETDFRIKDEKQLAEILKNGNYNLFGVSE